VACIVAGQEPSEEESWLALLAALQDHDHGTAVTARSSAPA
jgi:hypothetical protein